MYGNPITVHRPVLYLAMQFLEQLQLAAMVDGDCRPPRFAGGIFAGYGHIKSSIPTCVIIFVVKSFGKIW
jgi:hypothetical protein